MSQPVSEMMTLLCDVVQNLPVGTNLALLHLLWMMVSGHLLVSRGAIIPGLHHLGCRSQPRCELGRHCAEVGGPSVHC